MTTAAELERCDVAYSLIVDPEAGQILLVGHRDGYWSLPGGLREPGETLAATAIRETMEEAGDLPNITVELMVRGYSDEETGGVVVGRDLGPR